MATTKIGTHINAPRSTVYRLLLDGDAVAVWMPPPGITAEVHRFEPKEGGSFSITLAYDEPTEAGETQPIQRSACFGTFRTLVPDEQIVEVLEWVTVQPEMTGAQTLTYTLTDADGGTQLDILHENLPQALTLADNERTWYQSLANLAALAERESAS
ncbi:SRPBCC domain-containing protein [Nocardia sp. NPDC058658]|uniref:SRPBCC domain-containing protein n=1 Tax=Nocardia sp. NPDC058658 TaxID=3346580 RepID=UPI003652CF8B